VPTLGTIPSWLKPSPPKPFALSQQQQQAIAQLTPTLQAELKPATWFLAALLLLMALAAVASGRRPSSYEPVSRTVAGVQRSRARRASQKAALRSVATKAAEVAE